ncbi:hypothetical protein OOU_Y34scaffold00310g1 [Pyricularia oryzae Y34]|uniref:Uncharacterized protein n=1 Tax=Pyricularia oryzae (strain Y34) TaxID=1143189 RepID=A0AA97PND5_PYRO3|nr:hypothetical protein OOU_Y34scaffold00310g1 [Pyricularia oryzae Y34]
MRGLSTILAITLAFTSAVMAAPSSTYRPPFQPNDKPNKEVAQPFVSSTIPPPLGGPNSQLPSRPEDKPPYQPAGSKPVPPKRKRRIDEIFVRSYTKESTWHMEVSASSYNDSTMMEEEDENLTGPQGLALHSEKGTCERLVNVEGLKSSRTAHDCHLQLFSSFPAAEEANMVSIGTYCSSTYKPERREKGIKKKFQSESPE